MSCKPDGSDLTANCQFGEKRVLLEFFQGSGLLSAAKNLLYERLRYFLKLAEVVFYYSESERLAKGAAT